MSADNPVYPTEPELPIFEDLPPFTWQPKPWPPRIIPIGPGTPDITPDLPEPEPPHTLPFPL